VQGTAEGCGLVVAATSAACKFVEVIGGIARHEWKRDRPELLDLFLDGREHPFCTQAGNGPDANATSPFALVGLATTVDALGLHVNTSTKRHERLPT